MIFLISIKEGDRTLDEAENQHDYFGKYLKTIRIENKY